MAASDIFRAYLQPAKSVQDYADQYDVADMRRQSLAGGAFDLQQKQQAAQQAAQQRNALIEAFRAEQDPVRLEDQLMRNPMTLGQGQDMRKARTAAEEAAAKAGKAKAETTATTDKNQREAADAERAKRVRAIQDIASFKGPQDAIDSVGRHAKAGEIDNATAQRMVQQFQSMTTPEHWSSWQDQTLTSMMTPDQVKTHQRQLTNDAATNANRDLIAAPGGQFVPNAPLIDAKTRIAAAGAAQVPGMTYMTDKDGNIIGLPTKAPLGKKVVANVVTDATGARVPGKDSGLNDSQSKALLFGTRMQEADKTLGQMADAGVDRPSMVKSMAEGFPLVGGALGAALNGTQSPKQQQVEQAQRDFVNAVLRRESGAAISPGEFDSAAKQYFPSVGDSPQVKEQKAKNRKLAIQGLLAEVPQQKRGSITPGAPAAPAAASGWSIQRVD